ncbi:Rsd/AlgQ family anti-sigma factor [Methylosarcina fibrata]|uniref:Rsd/AlgQ family anti-sigma factor n=1 Tax=Methylosarcina fibrata TaxID=105972 RepID=UPI000368BDF1|nr:Rsd/AlgQ family anti-sigma factor [Methylosarcina fibrata]
MPVETPVKLERRQQAAQLIAELQSERQALWSLYCQIADLKPFTKVEQVRIKLTRFSQTLVDYVSLGHFGLYERILCGTERRNRILSVATDMYPEFSAVTEATLAFNDKYENLDVMETFDTLSEDLSAMGESLAKRFDLEDRLCELMQR